MRPKRKPGANLICRIDVTGFLAIQIVLLVMFMVRNGPDLPNWGTDDPKVFHSQPMPHANRENAIIVSVERDGNVRLGDTVIRSLHQLPIQIQDAVSHGSERKVYIHADAHAGYSDVRAVLSAVHSAGIENVAFFAYNRKEFQNLRQ